MRSDWDVIVIGGGAAGLMCAAQAGLRGRRVLLIEHNDQVGRKILISGGGRCNFTNINTTPANFLSQNPAFCISALSRFTQHDFVKLVERYNVEYYEKTLGQLFCRKASRAIVELLLDQCGQGNVEIVLNTRVQSVERKSRFELTTDRDQLSADSLVIATGGLSIPKLGASDFGLRIAQEFGHKLIAPYPALVPLTWREPDKALAELSGVSFLGIARTADAEFQEKILFTHRGLSGPAILQISSYWKPGMQVTVDCLPGVDCLSELVARKRAGDKTQLKNAFSTTLPKRFLDQWFEQDAFAARPLAECSQQQLEDVSRHLHSWQFTPGGTEGYAKAEVTAGGVDTKEVSSKTFESSKAPGLFFIGEVLDVTGHLGGYNFQWAWSSGYCAGQYV